MPNIISKPYEFALDTKITTPSKEKLTMFSGDSAIWKIKIMENNQPKDITECKITLLCTRGNEDIPYEQRDNILIRTGTPGVVEIQPKSDMTKAGKNIYQLLISDLDEAIYTQEFIFSIKPSQDGVVVNQAKEEINTIAEVKLLLDKYTTELFFLKEMIRETGIEIDNEIKNINDKIAELELNIRLLEHRVLGIANETTKLPNRIKLTPFDVQGSQYWYFSVDVKEQAITLLDKHFLLYMKGKLTTGNTANIHTCLSSISFSGRYDSKGLMQIYPYTNIINDPIINNRSISPSVVFNQDLSGFVSASSVNNKLLIKSNILKSTYIGEMDCYLNNLGANNLLIN